MKLEMEIDIDKFRYSLVGDGYLKKEVERMSEEKLLEILQKRISAHISMEYCKASRIGLLG